jgi:hypothetical protein
MRRPGAMKWMWYAVSAVLLGALTGPVFGQRAVGPPPPKPILDADHLRMQPEQTDPNGNTAVFGLQGSEGFYIYRNRFGPHQTSRPHFHDKDRWVTVIKGTWYTGAGDVFQADKMVPIKEGGVMYHPAGYHHYDGSMDDQGVVVQIMGYGPVKTIQTEVDEKGNPIGSNPLNPNPIPNRGRGEGSTSTAPSGRGAMPAGR